MFKNKFVPRFKLYYPEFSPLTLRDMVKGYHYYSRMDVLTRYELLDGYMAKFPLKK